MRRAYSGSMACSGLFIWQILTQEECPELGSGCHKGLSLGTNTSPLCFANLIRPAQLTEVCQTLHGAFSAEVFAASISCICMTAAFVQIWGITSTEIWSWLSLVCLDGEERPGFMLMFLIRLSGVMTLLGCRLSKIWVWKCLKYEAWIPRLFLQTLFKAELYDFTSEK